MRKEYEVDIGNCDCVAKQRAICLSAHMYIYEDTKLAENRPMPHSSVHFGPVNLVSPSFCSLALKTFYMKITAQIILSQRTKTASAKWK